jgi:hypothetical protein
VGLAETKNEAGPAVARDEELEAGEAPEVELQGGRGRARTSFEALDHGGVDLGKNRTATVVVLANVQNMKKSRGGKQVRRRRQQGKS